MYVVASFELSLFPELAITELEERGIQTNQIFAIPLEQRGENRGILDTIHKANGISLTDAAAALGTACMVLGTIYGFVLPWGPVIWALIGLAVGAIFGFVLDVLVTRRSSKPGRKSKQTAEVFFMIRCEQTQVDMVEQILWDHFALGVAKFRNGGSEGSAR